MQGSIRGSTFVYNKSEKIAGVGVREAHLSPESPTSHVIAEIGKTKNRLPLIRTDDTDWN
jgi:hypothetical protein